MKRALLLATAASLALSTPALSQNADADEIDTVIVTATRLETPQPLVAGAHVIDEARIERSGDVFVADILADVPGLSLYRSGAFGGVSSVRMRGAGQDKTLVLLDGVVLNDPSQPSGGYDFASLELGDISRIEVLSGPQGSLWGSDAIGGVIALTSRELDGARLDLEAGSLGTLRGAAGWGISTSGYAFNIQASSFETDGVSKADETDGNTERDGFTNRTLSLGGRAAAGPVTFDARLRWNDAVAEIDGFPVFALADTAEVSDTESTSGFVRARLELFGFDHALSLSRSEIDRSIAGGAFPSRYTGARTAWRWQADNAAVTDRLGLAFGLEREDTEGDLSTGDAEELGATSAFLAGRYQATDRLSVSVSGRLDDPDEYDGEATFRASLAYELAPGLIASAAYGQGFKTPTISQTLCDFCFAAIPFPELRPERAEGYDLGLSWNSADGRWGASATVYRLEVEDEIIYFFDTSTFDAYYVNVARTRSTGVELEGRLAISEALAVSASYGWTDAEDGDGNALLRVPEHSGSVSVDWTRGAWRAGLGVRAESEMLDSGGERDGFVIARATGGYALSEQAEVTLRIENLFDEHYQELLGYGEAGRAVYAGIRLRY